MGKGAASDRLERLERLKGLLKASDAMTVKALAAELGVSIRSLSRDIELLRAQGVPIEADRGRGGGVRLQRQWSFGRLHLDFEEGIDLLLSIDNSRSMADKQQILALAVPDLVKGLVNPGCVDPNTGEITSTPPGPLDKCPDGTQREFDPVLDIQNPDGLPATGFRLPIGR